MATRKYTKSLPERTNHGESKTPEYAAWRDMRHRCRNSTLRDWHLYGGRGISVCPQWVNDYLRTGDDMGLQPRHLGLTGFHHRSVGLYASVP